MAKKYMININSIATAQLLGFLVVLWFSPTL